jgi:hypothetical protein
MIKALAEVIKKSPNITMKIKGALNTINEQLELVINNQFVGNITKPGKQWVEITESN